MAKSSKASAFSSILALIVVVAVAFGMYRFIVWFFVLLNGVKSDALKAFITTGGTVAVAILSSAVGKLWEQNVRIKEEVRQRKLPIYESLIQSMFAVFLSHNESGPKPLEEDTVKAFGAFTERVIIWGGPEVIKKWTLFRLHDWSTGEAVVGFLKFEAFIKAVRTELGNSNSTLVDGDFLKLFINDLDPLKLLGQNLQKATADSPTLETK